MSDPTTTTTARLVEQRSIDYVPRGERHGRVWHQGPFWFAGNFGILVMLLGYTGPQLGLSLGWSILASTLGVCFGTFFMAFHANQGPRLGLPQMIQSRTQFGTRGAVIPLVATVFVYVGFFVFSTITAAELFQSVVPVSKWILYPILVAIPLVLAIFGYKILHFVQRWLAYVIIAVFTVVTISAIWVLPMPAEGPELGWSTAAFLTQFAVAAGFQISYAVYVSDYSRYLPHDASSPRLIGWTYAGAAGSAVWLMALGAIVAVKLPELDGVLGLKATGDALFLGLGVIAVLTIAANATFIQDINAYGAMLSGLTIVDAFRSIRPTARIRVIGLLVVGAVALGIALFAPGDYLANFTTFVTLLLYFLIPWTAVNLVDFYVLRHGRYAVADIFRSDGGVYGRWAWRGIVAYIAGFVAMIPFFSIPGFFTGPIAEALGGADLSFLVGLVVPAVLYYLFWRGVDRSAEERAIVESERLLEP